jgi:uncharacterized protein YukE
MTYMKAGEEDFRKLRDDHKNKADQIEDIVKFLDGSLRSSIWEGQAKTRFEGDWNATHKPNLLKLKAALHDLKDELESRRRWTQEFETAGRGGASRA